MLKWLLHKKLRGFARANGCDAVMAAQLYPTLKCALGHGRACTHIVIAGKAITPYAAAAA